MTQKTRKFLFLIFSTIFIFAAPTIILYFQGYRFDFEKKSLTQTGGLFLKIIPKQAEIYLDDNLVKKTDFFFGSAFIENLLPKKYHIEIKKEGYFSWKKDLEIKEKEVTEVKNIVLFPVNTNFNKLLQVKLSENQIFQYSPDGKKIIFEEIDGEHWSLKLYDLERNIKSHLIADNDIAKKEVRLSKVEFSPDSKEVYLKVGVDEKEKNFVFKLDKIPPILTEREIPSTSQNIITSQTFDNDNYSLDKFGYLSRDGDKINEKPFPIKKEIEYQLFIFPEYIFLREDKTLFKFNPDLKSFETFFDGINSLKISPDFKKLAYFSDSEIWILFLKDKLDQPLKKAGEKLFLVRLSEKIKDVFWLNSDYLIFSAGDKIKISEIDDRDKINLTDLAEIKNPEIFWNQNDKKLYVLSEGNLSVLSPVF